jgi:threonyl-tRNA synthetase
MLNEFDHRVLGANYNLFSFFEEGPGLPVWHERGLRIKNALIHEWRKLHQKNGYSEMESPIMLDVKLWEKSGHLDYFAENMYFSSVDKRDYAIKPMSCPGAILFFKQKKRSHAELPMRLCELGHVHRHENSGSLHGLMRVRSFVQDDAHIFCHESDLLSEIKGIIHLIEQLMNKCEIRDFHFELSLKGDKKKYLGEDRDWRVASEKLKQAVIECGHQVIEREGEAKFYGPSLDLHIKDRHGRFWQCSSIQLDFNLPARFDVHYFDKNGERQVPFMLHRALFGSLERFIGILLENFAKELPFWLHPVQYKVLSVSESVNEYAQSVIEKLQDKGHHIEWDLSSDPLKEKLKKSHQDLVHSVVIIGEKEQESGRLSAKVLKSGEVKLIV